MKTKFSAFLVAGLVLALLCAQGYAKEPKLDLRKIADKIVKTMNSADPMAVTNLYTRDAVMIQSGEPGPIRGHAALLKYQQDFYRAFSDFKVEFPSIFYSGDTMSGHPARHGPRG